jgi:predicted aspartyl protease
MKVSAAVAGLVAALALSGRAAADCKLMKIASLPATMEGGHAIISVEINGAPVRFIADSGAFYSMLSVASAKELKLSLESAPPQFSVAGVGGSVQSYVTTVKSFGVGKYKLPGVEFLVGGGDLSGGRAVGLIGQNVLGVGDVEYDLAQGDIRLFVPEGCADTDRAYWAGDKFVSVVAIKPRDNFEQPYTLAQVVVNGVKLDALFDTGAPTSMLSPAAARRAGIKLDGPGVRAAGYAGGLGSRKVQTWIASVKSLELGGEGIRNTEIRVGELPYGTDMLIGADFFLSHRVYVANTQRRMYFTYNGGPVFDLSIKSDAPEEDAAASMKAANAEPSASAGEASADPH